MKKLLTGVAVLLCAVCPQLLHAEAEFFDVITAKYKITESSKLGSLSCGICHLSDSDFRFNPYGKQVAAKLTEANAKVVTDAILTSVESMDADGDGLNNGEELSKGTQPGVADNPATTGGGGGTTPPPAPKPSNFPPKNGFHPAIVHFPIALLIAGLLLDLAGLIWKQKTLLFAGWYNLVLALVFSFSAIASGFLAVS